MKLLRFVLVPVSLILFSAWAEGQVCSLVVTNTNDSGVGSLRDAIACSNSMSGPNTITFNIPGSGVHFIQPLSGLPGISTTVTIDGYSQPGSSPNTLVNGDNAVILIQIDGSQSGGTDGITVGAAGSLVRGLSVTGFSGDGIGVSFGGDKSTIQGCFVGVAPDGMTAAGNGRGILGDLGTVIGGATPGARNIISGNIGEGIQLSFGSGCVVQGNYIGTGATGMLSLGNAGGGIISELDSDDLIGGTVAGAGNIVAFNGGAGVLIGCPDGCGTRIGILGNSIFSNAGVGISLGGVSPVPNDDCDGDSGANDQQNYPVLTRAEVVGNTTVIEAKLNSMASTSYRVELFSSPVCDPTGFGEGRTFLGSTTVKTDSSCNGSFSFSVPSALPVGYVVTATATDPSNSTSEFSACLTVTGGPSCLRPEVPFVSIDKSVVSVGDTYTLSWDASLPNPADGVYRIQISIDGSPFGDLAVTQNTSYTSAPVTFAPGTRVFFLVWAESSCGRSEFSSLASFTVTAAPCNPPGAASNVSITAVGVSPPRPPSPIEYILASWFGPVGGTPPTRYGVRINGDPEVLTTFTSLIFPPRGSRDPITAFVTAYTCGTLISAEVFDGAGTWSPTGSLGVPRQSHTATLLSGGKVLVAGGASTPFGPAIASAELFDPGTGGWSPTANLATARQSHTATALSNGKVLVSGGVSAGLAASGVFQPVAEDILAGAQLSSAELYDPAAGTWSATGNLGTPRALHTATLLSNGKVLVAGGRGGEPLDTAELYDPITGLWSSTGQLHTARLAHTATLLPNGQVLVAGGVSASGVLSSAELYDPSTGAWTSTGSLGTAREGQTATLLSSGKILVSGGDGGGVAVKDAELYDPAAGTWSATGSLGTARTLHTATLLPGGAVLAAGGSALLGPSLKSTELYDPAAGTWSATGNLNGAHGLHTATLLSSGNVLLAGLPDSIGPEQASPIAQSVTVALFLTPPGTDFTISPNPVVGQAVTFTDTSNPQATGWLWIFDDGTTDSRQSPTHIFTRAGTHSAALDATNGAGSQTKVRSFFVSAASAATASRQLESVAFDASDPVRQRATVTLGPQGSTWLHVRTGETQDTTLFLRFIGRDGALETERRLVVSPGAEAVYDLAAWGLKGTFSLELVCDRSFSASIVRSGRPGAKEITR